MSFIIILLIPYLSLTKCTLQDNIQDFIEPITIYATHNFTYNDSSEFCKICPVENKSAKSKSAQTLLLPFDIGCGEDRVCNSNISAIVKFREVRQVTLSFFKKCTAKWFTYTYWNTKYRENNSWVIGSNDITLEIRLENCAEPAYLTIIVFIFPEGIVLRSILPFCEEDTDGDNLMVICNVSNPLGMNEQVLTIKLRAFVLSIISNKWVPRLKRNKFKNF